MPASKMRQTKQHIKAPWYYRTIITYVSPVIKYHMDVSGHACWKHKKSLLFQSQVQVKVSFIVVYTSEMRQYGSRLSRVQRHIENTYK